MIEFIIKGALVSGSLIIAIGSQNAFVLKHGLLKQSVFLVCLICFVCDALLLSIGIFGLGGWIRGYPAIISLLAISGAIYLLSYGLRSFYSSYKGKRNLDTDNNLIEHRKKVPGGTILSALAITLLNPHVYLDTVFVIGGLAVTFTSDEKIFFLIGAVFSSFVWFFSIGYGAAVLRPIFKRPSTWRVFDFIIGVIMILIAFSLMRYVYLS